MAYEVKPNTGVLFKKTNKTLDTHPDYEGSLDVDGKSYFLDAWIKEGKNGKFFSVRVKPKTRQQGGSDDQDAPF